MNKSGEVKRRCASFIASVLSWIINILLRYNERCVIQNRDDTWFLHYVTNEEVANTTAKWMEEAKLTLYKHTRKYHEHRLAKMVKSAPIPVNAVGCSPLRRTILPTWSEIGRRVDAIAHKYKKQLAECETKFDLSFIMSCMNSDFEKINIEIIDRVGECSIYVLKSDRCFQFVGEVLHLSGLLDEFIALPMIEHQSAIEACLANELKNILSEWAVFCSEKNVADLERFAKKLDTMKKTIAVLGEQMLPKKRNGKTIDVESFLIGCTMEALGKQRRLQGDGSLM